jgi:hypothetical protein
MKAVRAIAQRLCRMDVLAAGLLGIVAQFALRAGAQVEYVDPTIGNVGILLVPTRVRPYTCPTAWCACIPCARTRWTTGFRVLSAHHQLPSHGRAYSASWPGDSDKPGRIRPGRNHAVLLFHTPRRVAHPDGVLPRPSALATSASPFQTGQGRAHPRQPSWHGDLEKQGGACDAAAKSSSAT